VVDHLHRSRLGAPPHPIGIKDWRGESRANFLGRPKKYHVLSAPSSPGSRRKQALLKIRWVAYAIGPKGAPLGQDPEAPSYL